MILSLWRILDKVYFFKIRLITNFVQRKSNIIKIKARRGLPLVKKSDTEDFLNWAGYCNLVEASQLLHADDCKTKNDISCQSLIK